MEIQDTFLLELSTKVALHGILLRQLTAHVIKGTPNPDKSLAALRESLLGSMQLENLSPDNSDLSPAQLDWVKRQSALGLSMAELLADDVSATIKRQG